KGLQQRSIKGCYKIAAGFHGEKSETRNQKSERIPKSEVSGSFRFGFWIFPAGGTLSRGLVFRSGIKRRCAHALQDLAEFAGPLAFGGGNVRAFCRVFSGDRRDHRSHRYAQSSHCAQSPRYG